MELKQMEYFKAIVDCGNISAAARQLHLTIPPLSYQMNQLEDELGVRLFWRRARKIELTAAGKVFYERAERILKLSESMSDEVSGMGSRQTLRLGITSSCGYLMAPVLQRMAAADPALRIELHDANTFRLRELLEDGLLDAAVIRTPVSLTGLQTLHLKHESLCAVSTEPIPGPVDIAVLSKYRLILYRRYENLISKTFGKYGLHEDVVCECDDARTALMMAEHDIGVAVVPHSIVAGRTDLHVREIAVPELETDILLAWHKASPMLELLRVECSSLQD